MARRPSRRRPRVLARGLPSEPIGSDILLAEYSGDGECKESVLFLGLDAVALGTSGKWRFAWVDPVSRREEIIVERGKRHGSPYRSRADGHAGGVGGDEVR